MEDNKQDQNNNPNGGNVMDVQPPSSQPNVPNVATPADSASGGPIPPAQPSQPPQEGGSLSPDLIAQAEAEIKKPAAQPDEKLLAAHGSHKKGPKFVIVLAVLVALALAGVAVYAYMKSRDDGTHRDPHTSGNHESSTEQKTEPASAKDVEDAAKELDTTVNATNEAQELPSDGLSEDAVGL